MMKDATITIRLPRPLKRKLETRARRRRRSLSAQVTSDLEAIIAAEGSDAAGGSFLGLYRGTRLPSDAELRQVRALLWGALGRTPAAT